MDYWYLARIPWENMQYWKLALFARFGVAWQNRGKLVLHFTSFKIYNSKTQKDQRRANDHTFCAFSGHFLQGIARDRDSFQMMSFNLPLDINGLFFSTAHFARFSSFSACLHHRIYHLVQLIRITWELNPRWYGKFQTRYLSIISLREAIRQEKCSFF